MRAALFRVGRLPYAAAVGVLTTAQARHEAQLKSKPSDTEPLDLATIERWSKKSHKKWKPQDIDRWSASLEPLLSTEELSLEEFYKHAIVPIEERHWLNEFVGAQPHSSVERVNVPFRRRLHDPLEQHAFNSKPIVLLLGQHSTGKTTMIKELTQREWRGMHIGKEATTDKIMVLKHGKDGAEPTGEQVLASLPAVPKSGGTMNAGLNHEGFTRSIEGRCLDVDVLKNLVLVDTPGILGLQKQRNRSYDFDLFISWMAHHASAIVFLFDPSQTDLSEPVIAAVNALRGHDDKLLMVFNKADECNNVSELVHTFGDLMQSIGRIFHDRPECKRTFITAFQKTRSIHGMDPVNELVDKDKDDLTQTILSLNDRMPLLRLQMVRRRVAQLRAHLHVIKHFKKEKRWWRSWQDVLSDESLSKQYKLISDREKDLRDDSFILPVDFRERMCQLCNEKSLHQIPDAQIELDLQKLGQIDLICRRQEEKMQKLD
jgi:GTPase SAR1 family protein